MKIIKTILSEDKKTVKFLQQTFDNHAIETSYFDLDENIICVSTQIGCPVGCIFCATASCVGNDGLKRSLIRNLTTQEIVKQVENILNYINQTKTKSKPVLLSYMGMGEPFLNYDNVVGSIKVLAAKYRTIKRATIATSGVFPAGIKALANESFDIKVNVHLSLHAPNNELRKQIMPKTSSINLALDAMRYFVEVKGGPVKINYILIKGVNDSNKNLYELARLLFNYRNDFIIKLTVLNEVNGCRPSDQERFDKFRKVLTKRGFEVVSFIGDGLDINASCGQLRRYHYDKNNLKV